jgi:lipid-A-disaccharide synthase
MLEAVRILRAERGALHARLILAPSLPNRVRSQARAQARACGCESLEVSTSTVLPAFDVALAASGTVTLECAMAGVPPVIVYRTGPLTARLARRLLRVKQVGLPNILLGEGRFVELLQEQVTGPLIAHHAGRVLDRRSEFLVWCAKVSDLLVVSNHESDFRTHTSQASGLLPSERVAHLVSSWLN